MKVRDENFNGCAGLFASRGLHNEAEWAAPPSSRSSRATMVMTTWESLSSFTEAATRSGSSFSGGCGDLEKSISQKPQLRVHSLPMTRKENPAPYPKSSPAKAPPTSSIPTANSSKKSPTLTAAPICEGWSLFF